jgi:hypothetical protein
MQSGLLWQVRLCSNSPDHIFSVSLFQLSSKNLRLLDLKATPRSPNIDLCTTHMPPTYCRAQTMTPRPWCDRFCDRKSPKKVSGHLNNSLMFKGNYFCVVSMLLLLPLCTGQMRPFQDKKPASVSQSLCVFLSGQSSSVLQATWFPGLSPLAFSI